MTIYDLFNKLNDKRVEIYSDNFASHFCEHGDEIQMICMKIRINIYKNIHMETYLKVYITNR